MTGQWNDWGTEETCPSPNFKTFILKKTKNSNNFNGGALQQIYHFMPLDKQNDSKDWLYKIESSQIMIYFSK